MVCFMTVGKQQMCEIAKAVSFDAKVIIFDEPSAALTEAEIEEMFKIFRDLKKNDIAMVYISHRRIAPRLHQRQKPLFFSNHSLYYSCRASLCILRLISVSVRIFVFELLLGLTNHFLYFRYHRVQIGRAHV